MPNPNLRRNLPAGKGGKRAGAGRKPDDDAGRKIALKLLNRPAYLAMMEAKMDDGTVHPSVHVALMYYGYGKPKETIETKQVTPVRIVHQYADDKDSDKS